MKVSTGSVTRRYFILFFPFSFLSLFLYIKLVFGDRKNKCIPDEVNLAATHFSVAAESFLREKGHTQKKKKKRTRKASAVIHVSKYRYRFNQVERYRRNLCASLIVLL